MGRMLARLGDFIVFSRHRQGLRRGVVFLVTNSLLIAGCVFAVEVLVILLGVKNVYLPLNHASLSFLTRLFL
jgi:hypothetical protein